MIVFLLHHLLSLIPVATFAAASLELASISDQTNQSIPSSPFAVNASLAKKLQIQCNAPLYGQNLKVSSCKKVFDLIVKDDKQITFTDRARKVPNDLHLPYRLQSSESRYSWVLRVFQADWIDDGVCFVQLVLAPGTQSGRASSTEFGQAGFTTFRQCVTQWGYGGIASDIGKSAQRYLSAERLEFLLGGDNQLQVIVASYKPYVKCNESPAPPWRSVVHIFANIEASKEKYIFGPQGSPGVEVELPWRLTASES